MAYPCLHSHRAARQKPCDLSPPGKLLGDWHDYQLLATLATEGNFSAYFQGSDKQWLTAKVGDYFSSPTTMITAISRESVTFKQLSHFRALLQHFKTRSNTQMQSLSDTCERVVFLHVMATQCDQRCGR